MIAVPSDPFSDILRLTEATSVMPGGFTAGGAWSVRFPPPGKIICYAVAKGSYWAKVDGVAKPVRAEPGDFGLLSGRDGFVLTSDLKLRPRALQFTPTGDLETIGVGDDCVVLAGLVSLHPSSAELLTDALPAIVHLPGSHPRAAALSWLVRQLLEELTSTLPGSTAVAAQLAQLAFVQILRTHLASSETLAPGWLRVISDERVSRALRLLHDQPARAWQVSELAKAAGMSRTRFAVHFKSVAGMAPLEYLVAWRMQLAQRILRDDNTPIAQLAATLGYASDSAFSNAFKRVTGIAPRDYRSRVRQ